MTKKIIVAHYNENLSWINETKFEGEKVIYSKTINDDLNKFIPINKGQEVPMYLKYIIDYYNDLPDKTLFLHGHFNSPHQDVNSKIICENVNWDFSDFFSVNRRDWYQEVSKNYQLSKNSFDEWLFNNWEIFDGYLDFPKNGLFFYSGAQFVVNKSLITQYPLSFYENLYKWILNTDISSVITSRIFEYTWHYIFTKNPIENKTSLENIIYGYNTNK